MKSWITQHKLAILAMLVLLLVTGVLFSQGWIGVEPLELDVVLLVNNREFNTFEQQTIPVEVEQGHFVHVEVKAFHDGQPIDSDLSFQWCFVPPIDNRQSCEMDSISSSNVDYKPEASFTQGLTVTVKHPDFVAKDIRLKFTPIVPSAPNESGDN